MALDPLTFTYTNYRGETAPRRVVPNRVFYGTVPPYHLTPGWFLEAFDLDRGEARTFDMRYITTQVPADGADAVWQANVVARVLAFLPPEHFIHRVIPSYVDWFVVGGAVHDARLCRTPKDVDIVVAAGAEDCDTLFAHLVDRAQAEAGVSVEVFPRDRILCMSAAGQISVELSVYSNLIAFADDVAVDVAAAAVRVKSRRLYNIGKLVAKEAVVYQRRFQIHTEKDAAPLMQKFIQKYEARGFRVRIDDQTL